MSRTWADEDVPNHSSEPCEAVAHEAAGDGNVQAPAAADHGDLDAGVGDFDEALRDSLVLVPEEHNRRMFRGRGTSAAFS